MAPCLATQQAKDLSSKSTTTRDAYTLVLRADPVTGCGELRGLCGYPRSCGRMAWSLGSIFRRPASMPSSVKGGWSHEASGPVPESVSGCEQP